MTVANGLTPEAPVRGMVRPVPVRGSRVRGAVHLPRGVRACSPLSTGSGHGLAGGAGRGGGRVVPKQSP